MKFFKKRINFIILLDIVFCNGTANRSAVDLANDVMKMADYNLMKFTRLTRSEIEQVEGIGPAKSTIIRAAQELGRRIAAATPPTETVTGGDFYYTSVGRPASGVDGASIKMGTYSELVGEVVNLDTLTVNTLTGEKLITANFHATVESTVTPEMITDEAARPFQE